MNEAPPQNAKNWKMSYCPKFFNGTCERNDLCNFIHHPNHVKNRTKNFSGRELEFELKKLNPYGYYNKQNFSVSSQDSQQQQFHGKNQTFDDVTKKLEKVQIRYDNYNRNKLIVRFETLTSFT